MVFKHHEARLHPLPTISDSSPSLLRRESLGRLFGSSLGK